jgi:hypothetical protein
MTTFQMRKLRPRGHVTGPDYIAEQDLNPEAELFTPALIHFCVTLHLNPLASWLSF